MNKAIRLIFATGLALSLGLGPAMAANGDSPEGIWQTTDRHMDYEFKFCAEGKQLCASLVGLRGEVAKDPRIKQFLNSTLLENAKPAGRNKWKGSMTILGHTGNGTITFIPGQKMVLYGCAYFVYCETFNLIPAK